ncbi:hypothetical protein ACHAXR_010250, partial [Thalassiosira sp. AJA248-18]
YAQPPPGRNNLAMQTGGQWTMASNRGPNAVGGTTNSAAVVPTAVPATSSSAVENSEYYKARNAQGGGQSFSWAASGGGGASPTAAAAPSVPAGVGGSWATAPVAPPPPLPSAQMSVAAQARQPSAAASNVASTIPVSSGGGGGSQSGFGGSSSGGFSAGGGDYEKNLIAELCPPGGMKAEPPEDKLEEFARAIPSLNPDLVCPALLDALEEGNPWIMRAKALCVIETVLKVEGETGGEVQSYTDFFHACSGEIEPLSNHARASVKGPAKRVLMALGINGSTTAFAVNGAGNAGATVSAAPAAPVAPPTNLLDFDEPAPAAAATLVSPAITVTDASPAGGGGEGSLFSGLSTKAASAASPPTVPTVQDDLLGGLSGPSPTEVSAVPAPVMANGGSSDLFGNMTVKSATAEAKTETAAPQPASAAPPAVPGSAFGFMNNSPSSPGVPPPPAQTTPAVSSPKAFDPLLSMGMSGAASTNAPISPNPNMAQMQQMQMAYQQNMMMMQQQMQQMQMAAAYGGGGPGVSPGGNNYQRQGSNNSSMPAAGMGGVPLMPMPGATKQPIMGANYMRQVPGVSGDNMSSFSFLGSNQKKQENHSFDFVKDAMKHEKK